jgi:hypothetical protein
MAEAEVLERQIQIADRCDSCGAQAFVLAKFANGELYFCGHHFAKFETKIRKTSFEVIDERNFINEKSASSA